ncbi:MAG: MBL fold metallo-hydrolase [Myxococcaceae bacterium]
MKYALVLVVLLAEGCARSVPVRSISACTALPASTSPLELVVLGSGGPRSTGRAASAYLVRVQGRPRVLIDVGPGAFLRMGELDVDFDGLDTVLLTHLHIDHAGDVPAFVKSRDLSYRKPLAFNFFGPSAGGEYPATSEFVAALFGSSGAFRYLPGFRNEMRVTDVPIGAEPRVLFDDAGLKVSAVSVDHGDVPALAFRVEFDGRGLVVTGDLASRDEAVLSLARGADTLVYDTAVLDPPAAPPHSLRAAHQSAAHRGDRSRRQRLDAGAQPPHPLGDGESGQGDGLDSCALCGARHLRQRLLAARARLATKGASPVTARLKGRLRADSKGD